jgi:inhibitor of cysteine peptidase
VGGELEKTYRETDAGARSELTAGEPFVVRLPENPTTGFHWELEPWDRAVVELVDDSLDPPVTQHIGSAAEHAWRFIARSPGTSSLRFALRRRWRREAAARYQLDIGVVPRPALRPGAGPRDELVE